MAGLVVVTAVPKVPSIRKQQVNQEQGVCGWHIRQLRRYVHMVGGSEEKHKSECIPRFIFSVRYSLYIVLYVLLMLRFKDCFFLFLFIPRVFALS